MIHLKNSDVPAGETVSGNFAIEHIAHLEQIKLAARGSASPLTDFTATNMKGEF